MGADLGGYQESVRQVSPSSGGTEVISGGVYMPMGDFLS